LGFPASSPREFVLFLCETWHDPDSVALRRLRVDGFQVVDRPRPREYADTLQTNHGGLAAVATSSVRLTRFDVGVDPVSFELLCVRVCVRSQSSIVAVVYRPGSAAVTTAFFSEMSDVIDRLSTFAEPTYLVGDVNVHLERPDDPASRQLCDEFEARGLTNCVSSPTHNLGGTLDVVISRIDLSLPCVEVVDVGLSDHYLLRWSVPTTRDGPVYVSTSRRPWKKLDSSLFRTALMASSLCEADVWSTLDVDGLSRLYDEVITSTLDRLVPVRTVRCCRRTSDAWFDDDCRVAKRCVRLFERDLRRLRRCTPQNTAAIDAATDVWTTRRREYRQLLRMKREAFWLAKVTSERSSPHLLWRSVDVLLGRGQIPTPQSIAATDVHACFDAKVAGVRASTAAAPPPVFTTAPLGCSLTDFRPLTVDDVIAAVAKLPDKSCASDPMPTSLLKENVDILAPFLTELFNRSLLLGTVPMIFKSAFITPRLKKPDLDSSEAKSYRPISNLTVLSKMLERLVAKQLLEYLTVADLLPALQSAYRVNHSTETAVLKVMADILHAVDNGDIAALALLDLSAAFDTVDHATLLHRLQISYGIGGRALDWFKSYLSDRFQSVRCGGSSSTPTLVCCGVPQGSVLGPILFLLYTADLLQLIRAHGLDTHLYADDTQVYGSCLPVACNELQGRISACINDVADWMSSNRLQLNADKTELIWCISARRQHLIPSGSFTVGANVITPVSTVRDLGIYIDSDLSMRTHVTKTVSACFSSLRQIRSIRRSVTRPVLQSLVASLTLTRLDFGCATLAGLPIRQLNRLQSVLNSAARLIYSRNKSAHVSPLLRELHWLRVRERIDFRLAVLVYRCLNGTAPRYLADELQRVADLHSRSRLRSATSASLHVPRSSHKTIGDRAFPVAAAKVWNSLPRSVTSQTSLLSFRRALKTELFRRSHGDS
jgi:Reverse transcriptase (RNA-dependent DNA polymerase)